MGPRGKASGGYGATFVWRPESGPLRTSLRKMREENAGEIVQENAGAISLRFNSVTHPHRFS